MPFFGRRPTINSFCMGRWFVHAAFCMIFRKMNYICPSLKKRRYSCNLQIHHGSLRLVSPDRATSLKYLLQSGESHCHCVVAFKLPSSRIPGACKNCLDFFIHPFHQPPAGYYPCNCKT